MSDDILDRDWKPNGRRPQSTLARSFSAELMDIFRIEDSISDLDQKVDERRQNVDKNAQELASIEARIREMEARLKGNKIGSNPRSPVPRTNVNAGPAGVAAAPADPSSQVHATDKDEKGRSSRPGTARAAQPAPSSGFMPPTPGASEGEYYLVTRADLDDQPR
jgi:TolA-binding protein